MAWAWAWSRVLVGLLGLGAAAGGLLSMAGCQAPVAEERAVWRYYPGQETFYSEAEDVYLVWDGQQWIEFHTRPPQLGPEDEAVPVTRIAPTPYSRWAPHPRSYKIPFDYEPYPYLRFRYEEPRIRPERPFYYDEQRYAP